MGEHPPFLARLLQGFTTQLFLFAFLPLTVLLLVVTFGSLSLHHTSMRDLVADRNLRAVQAAAVGLYAEVMHQGEVIALAAAEVDSPAQLNEIAGQLTNFSAGAALYSSQGELLSATPKAAAWTDALRSSRRYILVDLLDSQRQDYFFSPTVQLQNGQSLVMAAARTPSGDLLVGAFTPLDVIQHGLSWFTDTVAVTVVDRQQHVLYHSGGHTTTEEEVEPILIAALQGKSATRFLEGHHGDERVIAYTPVAPLGWVLLLDEPWETITSPLLRITQFTPLILAPVLLLALLAMWFGLRQIVVPLRALENNADELAEGNFEAIKRPVGGIPEIRRLQEALIDTAAKLQTAQENLHGYIGSLTAGVEQERRSLARELHDDTLQALIALNQRIQLAQIKSGDAPGNGSMHELQGLVQQTMLNLRRMVRGLRPIYLEDLGLAAAIGMLVKEQPAPDGQQVEFEVSGPERRLDPEAEMAYYRITQEAMANIARHAEAQHVMVRLVYEPEEVLLTIRDDGRGFNVPAQADALAPRGHYGLLGMRERAELAGARLEIQSAPGEGTTISVRLTAKQPARSN